MKGSITPTISTLAALGIGLATIPTFLLGPEVFAPAVAVATLASEAIENAPSIATSLWPRGTEDSQEIQIDALLNEITSLEDSLRTNLNTALARVQGINQSDVSTFLAFTGSGIFSTSQGSQPLVTATLDAPVQPLRLAFITFLVSTALAQNGWHVMLIPGVNPSAYANGSQGCPNWAPSCSGDNELKSCNKGYDGNWQCNDSYWWYSRRHNSAYTLNHNDDTSSTQGIHDILANSWSTGLLLFENAAVCNLQQMLKSVDGIKNIKYTSMGGEMGFMFQGSIPQLDPGDISIVGGMTFLPIGNGSGLFHLAQSSQFVDKTYHPNGEIWALGPNGLDFTCNSQLNVSVANTWGHPWAKPPSS